MSARSATSSSDHGRRARVERHARRRQPASRIAAESAVDVRRRLGVEGDRVGPGRGELGDLALGVARSSGGTSRTPPASWTWSAIAETISGPIVIGGTKCPSITSTWMTRAPASITSADLRRRACEKSAERIEGAILRPGPGQRAAVDGAHTSLQHRLAARLAAQVAVGAHPRDRLVVAAARALGDELVALQAVDAAEAAGQLGRPQPRLAAARTGRALEHGLGLDQDSSAPLQSRYEEALAGVAAGQQLQGALDEPDRPRRERAASGRRRSIVLAAREHPFEHSLGLAPARSCRPSRRRVRRGRSASRPASSRRSCRRGELAGHRQHRAASGRRGARRGCRGLCMARPRGRDRSPPPRSAAAPSPSITSTLAHPARSQISLELPRPARVALDRDDLAPGPERLRRAASS